VNHLNTGLGFTEMLNYSTNYVWPVAKPFVAPIAESILNRSKNYLMHSEVPSLQQPGVLAILDNISAIGSNATPPITTIHAEFMF